MVKPFSRPSINLDRKVTRSWKYMEASLLRPGDVVAMMGRVIVADLERGSVTFESGEACPAGGAVTWAFAEAETCEASMEDGTTPGALGTLSGRCARPVEHEGRHVALRGAWE